MPAAKFYQIGEGGPLAIEQGGVITLLPRGTASPEFGARLAITTPQRVFVYEYAEVQNQAGAAVGNKAAVLSYLAPFFDVAPLAGAYSAGVGITQSNYWFEPMRAVPGNNAGAAIQANTLVAKPFVILNDLDVLRFGVRCQSTAAGAFFSFGIYKFGEINSNDLFVPKDILMLAGQKVKVENIALLSSDVIATLPSKAKLKPGHYALVIHSNANFTLMGIARNEDRYAYGLGFSALPSQPCNSIYSNIGAVEFNVGQSLPDTLPVLPNKAYQNSVQPTVFFRGT